MKKPRNLAGSGLFHFWLLHSSRDLVVDHVAAPPQILLDLGLLGCSLEVQIHNLVAATTLGVNDSGEPVELLGLTRAQLPHEAQLKLRRNAMAIYQDLVDQHGIAGKYNSVNQVRYGSHAEVLTLAAAGGHPGGICSTEPVASPGEFDAAAGARRSRAGCGAQPAASLSRF
ncbi:MULTISPECIES: hypothetical protein [Ramlibacter]|uniref:Uncharacterized protein n=1 Tax=Ramlibacter aquaticus TaxID=2780094 RepID=A0ABR9SCL1_9BURK|nr:MULTISPECIES: hypothetical protein [Ramlibacter]MBE7940092.1 hypothetical protein [Ramlibacter aquaticus]